MNTLNRFLTLLFLVLTISACSQQIQISKGKDYLKKCRECINLVNNKPQEAQYGIQKDDSDHLYFVCTNLEWFAKVIKNKKDGIVIDIVSKDRYSCGKNIASAMLPVRGDLQKPMYLKDLKRNTLPSNHDELVIDMGALPEKYKDQDIEFNIAFIKNRQLCHYSAHISIKTYRWNLLDMGFYLDTLAYESGRDSLFIEQERYALLDKEMKFEIPFAKNKSDYSSADIKPLYDSLNLTDFNIKKITIRAYSSIEGNEERNSQLQQERAQSIVNALQSYQKPTIATEISVSENWVDFLNDVVNTPYSYLSGLSKDEVREKLKDREMMSQLEPYLQKHRKAIIILELQKRNKYEDVTAVELVDLFSQSVSEKNLKQAIDIQNSIFGKVINNEIPGSNIDKLEIPERTEFSLLLNKLAIFKYLTGETDVMTTYRELQELDHLIPNDAYIKYNLCALKFKVWSYGGDAVDPADFKKEITDLKKWDIPNSLIRRMLVNYEIIMSELYMLEGNFASKDRSLRYIYSNFKSSILSEADCLSLAQYFASYARYDWATKLLEKRAKSVDVDEDLLFYYLNLTLVDDKLIKRTDYRAILLNAYNLNPVRFCKIFDSPEKGGMTFQLLGNEYLRKVYCENCM